MRKLAPVVAVLVVLAGCKAKTPVVPPGSPSPTPSPSPTQTRARVPVATSVVYTLGSALYVYDVKNDTETELARGEGIRLARWVSRDEVSFVQGDGESDAIRLLNIKSRSVSDLLTVDGGVKTYGWTPDRETIGYITTDEEGTPHVEFRSLVGSGATRGVAVLAPAPGREGVPDDQLRLEFDRTGQNALIVYTPSDGFGDPVPSEQSQLQVRSLTGDLLHAGDPDEEPTMGFWAPNGKRVYYRTDRGARVWTVKSGALNSIRGGTKWFNPWPSRDGKLIAYDTGATSGSVRVRLLTLKNGTTRTIGGTKRYHPVIASTRTIWAQGVKRCTGTCLLPYEAARSVYAIDLKTGKERKLALRSLIGADVLYR